MDAPSFPPRSDAVELVLNRHTTRRAAGLPTVSVLVGPIGAGVAAFRAWATQHARALQVGTAADAAGVADLVARAAISGRDLVADACSYLAAHTGRPAAELRAALAGMTRHDLDRLFAANDARLPPGDGTRLARRLCEAVSTGEEASAGGARTGTDTVEELLGLAALIPVASAPAGLVIPPPAGGGREWFGPASAAAIALATRVPQFPIAVAIPSAVWAEYLGTAPDNRAKALLREGVLELPVMAREVERLLACAGSLPLQVPPAVASIIAEGVPGTFAAALATVTAIPARATTTSADDAARSAAERFLYEFLELLPATVGRFELNADPGFRFGPRAAEVDLLARDLRIAIEIDGYYHFRDESNYRRDRSKDWSLQMHGFLVLRFMADDIIPRLEEVRDRILAAVALRTAGGTA